ncbi:Respiratory burst oxidase [Quillaja saponaria]|uniref:Respiratory burst oxidase n=1 Tax=Quillaja saponaria TaxID=32244 RepID=A0AAD7VKA8_QUISA|nr:Respiratory burst oxidase [Quillaja saponaria]
MDTQNAKEPSLIPVLSKSSSSSSATSSSSSSIADIANLPFSPVQTGSRTTELATGLIDFLGHSGMEWKDVEERFNQVSSTRKGIEPVLKWSDFGFCIGMQQSPEFAKELLRAVRGGTKDWRIDITKTDLHKFWCLLKGDCFDSRMRVFFNLCDRDMDGRVTEMDIKQTIMLSASTNKLSLSHEEAEDFAALIMELLDKEDRGYIEISQLESLFKARLPKASSSQTKQKSITHHVYNYDHQEATMSKAEFLFRTYWRRGWMVSIWLLACIALFVWKFFQYRDRTAFQVMGYCLSTAKGAAETLKLNMALILLPVCRNTITWLRKNRRISSIVAFDDNLNFHKLIAGGIVLGVILHGGTHLACDFPRISGSDRSIFRQTIGGRFGYHQPTYIEILATTEVVTGFGMVVLMVIAFSLATKWPRRQSTLLPLSVRRITGYNTFWYSHHLFILVYALLIIHSMFLFLTDNVTEKTTWMYIIIPVLLYAGERIFRAIRSGFYEVDILKASIYPGKVLSLKMQKPEGFRYQSGMYIFIQCPQISQFEWHPYSLTSGPQDDYLSVHIRTLGDWSYQMYSLFQEAMLSGLKKCPKVHIDGPYGAASQDHVKYDIVMLIGLGIGATPFISILKDIVNNARKESCDQPGYREYSSIKGPLKAYLYWVTREQSSFDWFRDIMKEISISNQKQSVVETHNFLTSVYQEGDVRSSLLRVIQALHHAKNGIDIVSRTPVCTHFGRPNWFSIFSKLAQKHRGQKIGVFYCGPSASARELNRVCTKYSTKTTTRFVFHKENY